jgi:hypothetical protein
MRPAARIGAFAALLAVVFAGAALAGDRIDPDVDDGAGGEAGGKATEGMNTHTETQTSSDEQAGAAPAASLPGLAVAQDGYRLELGETRLDPGAGTELSFRIADEHGATVEDFDLEHERRMHLIVVRRDFAGFKHLHPEQASDGSWSVELGPTLPGVHRVFADFSSGGASVTPAADLFVPGDFVPEALPEPALTADAGDSYEVEIEAGDPHAGETARVRFVVSRDGRELDGVEPYLGADGHLVALREGDQAFLHTHPEGSPGGPGPIAFSVSYPSAGRYRLFLQFRHGGEVRTAAFTQEVEPAGSEGSGQ